MSKDQSSRREIVVVNNNICHIKGFERGDDWEIFSERLGQYFEANRIEDERKTAVLLTLIDEDVYRTLKNLCDPTLPKTKTYELVQLLETQFKIRVSVFRKRILFNNLGQVEETISKSQATCSTSQIW